VGVECQVIQPTGPHAPSVCRWEPHVPTPAHQTTPSAVTDCHHHSKACTCKQSKMTSCARLKERMREEELAHDGHPGGRLSAGARLQCNREIAADACTRAIEDVTHSACARTLTHCVLVKPRKDTVHKGKQSVEGCTRCSPSART